MKTFNDKNIYSDEIWMVIPNHPLYQVSNYGRFKGQFNQIVSLSISNFGYLMVRFIINGKRKYFFAHRMVGLCFIPNPLNKPFINHKDGNKKNNKSDNLEWVTTQENMDHSWETGLRNYRGGNHWTHKRPETVICGEKVNTAKLTREDVLKIREIFSCGGVTQTSLSKQYNVTLQAINRIILRKNWKHI